MEELRSLKLKEAAKKVGDSIKEILNCCDFPVEHCTHARTNNNVMNGWTGRFVAVRKGQQTPSIEKSDLILFCALNGLRST